MPGGHENLGSQEFHKLVSGHLPNILTSSDCKEAVEQMKQQLDKNKDGKISFEEYMTLIGTLACMLSRQRMAQLEQD
ncbi:LOW QUALITY PROTEIN: protein S100-A16-like [Erpetoichthys calabaricus]|uniref:LOW QUALITY PROTEIN: protein S100-A16-like n=1 Tax=Erpetoichthys calabaricus TaxID=27687 RepID=UPI002234BC1C|nr:LOW QUALITY PROTEIN: protein S100-A16-like [Erpetoichthys calabaricus]